MLVQITTAGAAALTANGGIPLPMANGKFGSGVNYIPNPAQTDIQGTEVASQVPLGPQMVNNNVVRYSMFLDINVGPYDFGEIGLFLQDGTLFAISTATELISKLPVGPGDGNTISVDLYLNSNNLNYAAWLELSDTSDYLNVPRIGSVDLLPPSSQAIPNLYVVQPSTPQQTPFLAYSDQAVLWSFDKYEFSTTIQNQYSIVSATNTSVVIDNAFYNAVLVPAFVGDKVLQFNSGAAYGICRNIATVIQGATTTTISFSAMAVPPLAGDTFLLYSLDPTSVQNIVVPVATTTSLGVVEIGDGLDVTPPDLVNNDPGGRISVNRATVPDGIVWSIGTKQGTRLQGDVPALNANQLIGSVLTVNNQGPDANGNVTVPGGGAGSVPIATLTTLGVVKGDPAGNVNIAPDGSLGLAFTPVKTVNNVAPNTSGNATVVGLVTPIALTNGQDLNTVSTAGLYYAGTDAIAASLLNKPTDVTLVSGTLEVIPLSLTGVSGDVIQRWTQHGYTSERRLTGATWSAWFSAAAGNVGAVRIIADWNALTNSAVVGADTHVLLAGGMVQITGPGGTSTVSGLGRQYRVIVANNAYTGSPLTLDGTTTFARGDVVQGFSGSWTRILGNTILVS